MREYGPAFSVPAWFGDPTGHIPERYRSRYLRAVWQLAEQDLINATKTGTRLSNIRLTPEGKAFAEKLTPQPVAASAAEAT